MVPGQEHRRNPSQAGASLGRPLPQVAFLFPGQGSQRVGMGRDLFDSVPAAREVYVAADRILGFPLSSITFEGPAESLDDTVNAQPAILTTSVAILRALEQEVAVHPAYAAGHSMGEFSALVCAGALDFVQGLHLVWARGRLMKRAGELNPGGMVAILGLDADRVGVLCAAAEKETGKRVQVANDNCPGQVVASGARPALERLMELARAENARKIVPLRVSIAAHSPLMQVVAADFAAKVQQAAIRRPWFPVVGNTRAEPLTDAPGIREELVAQLTSSVRWTESIRCLQSRGVQAYVEIGPDTVLAGLAKRIDPQTPRFSVQNLADVGVFADWFRGEAQYAP